MLTNIGMTVVIALMGAAEPGVNANVHPGDDFFAYANGAWLEGTAIPAGNSRWGARNEISEITQRQVDQLITDAARAPAQSDARKIADFRAAYLDQASIDAHGITPFAPLFQRIDAVNDKAALTRLLGSEMRADVDPLNKGIYSSASLLGLAVEAGNHGEARYVAFLLQGGLGLPDRQQYLDPSPDMQALRAQHEARIARVLGLFGFDRSAQRAKAVMELETAIAASHASPEDSGDERNADNLWTRADFPRRAPGMDWDAYFAAAGLSRQESFVAWQPSAIEGVARLVDSYPLETWRNYLRFHSIDVHAEVLPNAYATIVATPALRSQRATEATLREMSGAIGMVYANTYFPPERKAKVQVIVRNVIAAFRKRIESVTWLSPASRQQALTKLDAIYFGVGYPEKWPNYSTLTMNPTDALGNLKRMAEWNYDSAVARLDQPADHTDWAIAPEVAGAALLFHQNAYNFAAALLQPPKYDPAASDAANYGAIGAIVGHEVSHFVDTLGADYDASGRKVRWWTSDDLAQYEIATQPLIRQFSRYRPFPDLAVDGKLTLVENVADLAGLAAAFDAYRDTLGAKAHDKQLLRQQDRQFFIGFARAWRAKYHDDALRKQVTTTDHAPETYRVATVRNLDAWYDAFDVRPGNRLYLEPRSRVHIW